MSGAIARRRGDLWLVARMVFLVLLGVFALLPMVWMVLTSLKTQFAALQYPPEWSPRNVTFEEYAALLSPSNDVGREFLHLYGQ